MSARHAIAAIVIAAALAVPSRAAAADRFALVVAGATGGQEYAERYTRWTDALSKLLVERFKFDPAHVTCLSETAAPATAATSANVRRVLQQIHQSMTRDDLLFIILIGHGTFDGVDAKFNLVGPDLDSSEWAALLKPLAGRVILVDTTAGSFPFLERLAGPNHIIIAATDSVAQRLDTVFPDYFIGAWTDDASDIDKNGRVSVWEAFSAASARVRRHYQQRGLLATERALLDDNADGVGSEAAAPKDDGSLASRTYLDDLAADAAPTDDVLLKLLQRRATLEADVEDLKIRRTFMPPADYAQEFERLMTGLARVSHDIRERTKTAPEPRKTRPAIPLKLCHAAFADHEDVSRRLR